MDRRTKNRLDKKWSKKVKEIAKGKCEYCSSTHYLNSHHIFSRKFLNTRFDINNGVCLCAAHHLPFAHHKSLEFSIWVISTRGDEWYDDLVIKSRVVKPILDIEKIEKELNGETDIHSKPS